MMLTDIYCRSISYLRISLTERCNLKCAYCYGDISNCLAPETLLPDTGLLKLINAFALLGIDKIRFTGGEPLLREDLVDIIGDTSKLESVKVIGLTTNGILLAPRLDSLVRAGLNRLNISLDSLDRNTYAEITGHDRLHAVLDAVDLALGYDIFERIKINVVVMRGVNDSEIPEFVKWAIDKKIDLRFIEFMPAYKSGWGEELFVGEYEMKDRIGLNLKAVSTANINSGPARSYEYRDYPGRISFVSALSRGFCKSCNRLRLTSKGDLVGCLFDNRSVNLAGLVENNDSIEKVAVKLKGIFDRQLYRKPPRIGISYACSPIMREIGG